MFLRHSPRSSLINCPNTVRAPPTPPRPSHRFHIRHGYACRRRHRHLSRPAFSGHGPCHMITYVCTLYTTRLPHSSIPSFPSIRLQIHAHHLVVASARQHLNSNTFCSPSYSEFILKIRASLPCAPSLIYYLAFKSAFALVKTSLTLLEHSVQRRQ